MPRKTRAYARAAIALAVLSLVWGYNWVVMKRALADIGAFDFAALRTLAGAAGLFVVLLVLRRSLRPHNVPGLVLLGVLQTTGFVGLTTLALAHGGAGKTAVLVYTMPFWAIVMARLLLGERMNAGQWLAVALALIGLVLVIEPWALRGVASEGIAVAAGISWAASSIVAKTLRRDARSDLLSLAAWQLLFGAVILVALDAAFGHAPIRWTPYLVGALAYNAILVSALGWWLWLYSLDQLPAGVASLGVLATPVLGVLAAWLQLGERPGPWEVAGMLLIGGALGLLSLQGIRAHRRDAAVVAQE